MALGPVVKVALRWSLTRIDTPVKAADERKVKMQRVEANDDISSVKKREQSVDWRLTGFGLVAPPVGSATPVASHRRLEYWIG